MHSCRRSSRRRHQQCHCPLRQRVQTGQAVNAQAAPVQVVRRTMSSSSFPRLTCFASACGCVLRRVDEDPHNKKEMSFHPSTSFQTNSAKAVHDDVEGFVGHVLCEKSVHFSAKFWNASDLVVSGSECHFGIGVGSHLRFRVRLRQVVVLLSVRHPRSLFWSCPVTKYGKFSHLD